MGLVFKNNAKTTLSSGVNDSTTTIPVTEGSVFPAANLASQGTYFFVTLDDDTNNEIVKVAASSGSAGNQNLTVVRAQESTSARAFSSGNKVELRMTAGVVDTFNLTAADITLDASNDRLGFGDTSPEVSLDLGAKTDALHAPVGTTAQRPGSPEAGYLRYNSTTGKFEGYTNAWGDLADGSDFLVTNSFTTANNSTTAFTISNAVQDEKQLLVFIDGVFQAHNSYSVSGTTVTLSTAPASGREVTIYSALSNLQGANMVIATMTGDNSDTTLDLGVTPVSENNVQVYFDGVYQHKSTFSISGQILTFSTAPPTGVAVEAITHTVLDISAAASSVLIDEFTGDGSDTTFTLSAAPANENNTQVYVGGVYQEKATYSVSGTTLTFSEAPANGVSIEVMSIAVGQINSAIQLSDADGDTKVMVEESSDEDKIRFDTGGTERAVIDSTGMEVTGDITVSGSSPEVTFETGASHYNWQIAAQESTNSALEIAVGSADADASNDSFSPLMTVLQSGDVGIGTTTIPHGGVGAAKLALEGGDQNFTTGPHVQMTTASDNHPLMQILAFSHDNVSINFDSYHDGSTWKSSDAGTNFQIYKLSDSLQFRYAAGVSAGSEPTWAGAMNIDSSGHVTMPQQTAVLVSKSSSQLNIAVSSTVTHTFDNEQFDVNGDFASNTFTAPVTGKYLVCLQIRWQNIPTNINYIQTWLTTSNGTRYMGLFGSGTDLFNAEVNYYRDGQSIIIDMDANDTFTVSSSQSGGTQQTDIGQESYLSVALLS